MAFLEYREEALQDATDRLVYKLVRVCYPFQQFVYKTLCQRGDD